MKKWIIPAVAASLGLAAWAGFSSPDTTMIVPEKTRAASTEVTNPARIARKALRAPGDAFTLPVELAPTAAQAGNFVYLDVNCDEKTWTCTEGQMQYTWHSKNNADDWFFVPVRLSAADRMLQISFKMKSQGNYEEKLEVFYGAAATPASMTESLFSIVRTGGQFEDYTNTLTVDPSTGIGYFGFHAASDADKYGINVKDIVIESLSQPIPLAPSITASSINELEYSATVTLPASTLQGEQISGNVGLQVSVDGVEVENHADCAPGSTKDVSLTLTKGTHSISYAAYLVTDGVAKYSQAVAEEVRATAAAVAEQLPVLFEPSDEDFENSVVIDANNDGSTWSLHSNGSFRYYYNGLNAGDDWLILPIVDFGADNGTFEISMDVNGEGYSYTETFEVCVGRTLSPADMTVVFSPAAVQTSNWEPRSGKFTLTEGGKWYVALHATSPKDQYSLYVKNIAISRSADRTPAAAVIKSLEFNGLEGELVATLPTETVDGVALEGNVGVAVTVDGVDYDTSAMAAPGSDVTVPVTLTLGKHTIGVAAFIEDGGTRLTGAQVLREVVARNAAGFAYPIPFTMHPTLGEFETLDIVDANNDGFTWDYNAGAANGTGAAVCRTSGDETADDWLFFPAVAVTDITRIYSVSVEARAYLEQYPEDFDLCIGTSPTPEAMTKVVEAEGFKTYLYAPVAGEWIAPAAGNYHVGIHRRSAGSAHTLSIMNVSVTDAGKSVLAPAACSDIDAAGDASGALLANVSLTLPTEAINGTALDASASLTATVTSATGATVTVTGLPGERVSVSLAAPDGHSTITVVASSAAYGAGEPAETTVYCGLDRPSSPVVTSEVSADNMSLTLTWTDPARGEQGGAIDVAGLSHTIYTPIDPQGLYWSKVVELPVGQNSYTFEAGLLQDITFVGVSATNSKGESQLGVGYGVTGAPYSLPLTEDLSKGTYTYSPVVTDTPAEDYSTNWFLDSPALIYPSLGEDAGSALMCIEASAPVSPLGRVSLPKFSTVGAHAPQITMCVYDAPQAAPATVYAASYGMDDVKIGEISGKGSEGWTDYTFDLPASLLDKAWVNLYIVASFDAAPQAFVLRSYSVKSTYGKQLSTRLQAPAEMEVGQLYTLTAKVTNGSLTAQQLPDFSLTVSYGDVTETVEPSRVPADNSIAPEASLEIGFDFRPVAEMIGEARLTFSLTEYSDEMPDDDSDYADVRIVTGGRPVVTDLSGSHSDNGLLLGWTAPELGSTGNDDFEGYAPFDFSKNLGSWLNIDADGKVPYAIAQNVTYPGCDSPRAFQVMNASAENGIDLDLKAHSGDQYLLAVCPDDGSAADDWLISPEVAGGSKVSFRFNVLNSLYGTEQIDLMYSSTGREPADFTLLQTYSQNMRGWNPLEKTLPDDARYFAFHYRSKDVFGVALDDVFYTPVSEVPLTGYHIYRNGDRIASAHPETSFAVDSWKEGDRFNVAAMAVANGNEMEHPMSNTFVALTSSLGETVSFGAIRGEAGAVVVEGMQGRAASVLTPDGRVAASVASLGDCERVALAPGVYIVHVSGGAVAKVRVD